jgi:hypothetical protein
VVVVEAAGPFTMPASSTPVWFKMLSNAPPSASNPSVVVTVEMGAVVAVVGASDARGLWFDFG